MKPPNYTSLPTRFWDKVEVAPTNCWIWTGATTDWGYGTFGVQGKTEYAHRLAYLDVHVSIPEGLEIDHLCRVTLCLNPEHLEAVTHRVNVLRGNSPSARHARKTHCIHGHEFTRANTYIRKDTGSRACKYCRARALIAWRAQRATVVMEAAG